MNCEKALEQLSAMLDGELGDAEELALREHLAACPTCQAVFETMRDIDAAIAEAQLEPPAALRENVMREVRTGSRRQSKRRVTVAVIGTAAAIALILGALGQIDLPGFSGWQQSTASLHGLVESLSSAGADAQAYAEENECTVLAFWGCDGLVELDGVEAQPLSDGGRLYPVDAKTVEMLRTAYAGQYEMRSYAPTGEARAAAVVIYP